MCRTSGRGSAEEGVGQRVALPGGRWAAGTTREVPFQVPGPRWPPAWAGSVTRWDWYVEAWARLAGARDAGVAVPVRVTHDGAGLAVAPTRTGDPSRVYGARGHWRTLLWIGLVLAACGAVIYHGGSRGRDYWIAGAIVAGFTVVPLIGTVWGLLAARKVGNVQTRVRHLAADGALECTVWMKPTADVRAVEATLAVLELTERTIPNESSEKHEHTLHQQTVELVRVPGGAGEYTGFLPLPPAGALPYSVQWAHSQISWRVHIRVSIPAWPDEEDTILLHALPAHGPAAELHAERPGRPA